MTRKAGGRVTFRGADITRARPHEIVARGLVQVPEGRAIVATMGVRENLELGGYTRRDTAALRAEIAGMYERFPVLGERRSVRAGSLSGGEQQMLAIARAGCWPDRPCCCWTSRRWAWRRNWYAR